MMMKPKHRRHVERLIRIADQKLLEAIRLGVGVRQAQLVVARLVKERETGEQDRATHFGSDYEIWIEDEMIYKEDGGVDVTPAALEGRQ